MLGSTAIRYPLGNEPVVLKDAVSVNFKAFMLCSIWWSGGCLWAGRGEHLKGCTGYGPTNQSNSLLCLVVAQPFAEAKPATYWVT